MDFFHTAEYPTVRAERDQINMLISSRDPEALMSCDLSPDEARLLGLELIRKADKADDWTGEDE